MPYRILLIVTCLLFSQAGQTQQRTEALKKRIEREYAWTRTAWTGASGPYVAIQTQMEKIEHEKKDMTAVANQLGRLTAKQKSSDPQAVFRWAYATWLAYGTSIANLAKRTDAMAAMGKVATPHVYEFDRLRFILLCCDNPDNDLKGLGERLLKRRPRDYWVIACQIYIMCPGSYPADKKRAFELCSLMLQALPNDPNVHVLIGTTWEHIGWVSHKKADAQKALASYRKAFDLMSPNNPGRQNVLRQIEFVQQDLRDYK